MIFKLLRKKFRDFYKPYWCLALMRIILVLIPQTGYIHPDEFFQSIEVLVGKFFEVEVNKPWEFTTTFPIRSITLPYFILGTSYQILKILNTLTAMVLNVTIITPYTLVLFPRLLICMLSFLVDWSLYKICVNNNEKYKARLLILASSYVMIVFGTRTFSNTFELILFALLLYYVADSMTFSNIIVKQHEYLTKRYNKSKTEVERAKLHKLKLFLASHTLKNCMQISTITVVGFFNRPTFLGFALFPIFFWLYRGIGFKSVMSMQFHFRMFVILACAIPTILFFVLVDSLYYGYLSFAEIDYFTVNINNFVFTPLNFFKYNINPKNLADHGLHPRYLHLLVNTPLLFNVLAIFGFFELLNLLVYAVQLKFHLLPTVRSIKGLMIMSLVAPIAFLSIFPHQEARFLIPTIVPMVYLYAHSVLQEQDFSLIEMTKEALTLDFMQRKLKAQNYFYLKLWLVINIVFLIFFGFFHQGGVISATSHLSKEINQKPLTAQFRIYSTHIYSIPESLFMQKSTDKLYIYRKSKYKVSKRVFLYEEGSKDLSLVLEKLVSSINCSDTTPRNNFTYIVFPTSLKRDLELLILNEDFYNLNLQFCTNFYPHVSTEAFPNLSQLVKQIFSHEYYKISQLIDNILLFLKSFGLTVCKTSYHCAL